MYAAHQCARFSENPKESHAKAIRRIAGYLGDTRNQGIIIDPRKELLCLEVYADADWSGNYFKKTASEDPSTAKSRTGFVIFSEELRFYGNRSCKLKSHYPLQRQNILHYLRPLEKQFR